MGVVEGEGVEGEGVTTVGGVAGVVGVVGVVVMWLLIRGETGCVSEGVEPRWRAFFRGLRCGGDKIPVWLSRSDDVMLDSNFGDSKFGKAGGGPGSSSSDDPIIHPLGGTFTCVSPSRASSLGEFFFGTVSGEEVTGTRGRSPFSEFTRRGLGTGRSAFSGGPDDEEGESDEAVVGGEMGEGMRGVGCWVQEGRSGSDIREEEISVLY